MHPSGLQAAEKSFVHRVAGLSLRYRVRSSDIQRELGVEPCGERSQWRWFVHGVPQEKLDNVTGEREVWNTLLSLLITRPNHE